MLTLYMDEHIPVSVSKGLKRRGIDVLTTQEADHCGHSDEEQLHFALETGRVLVTFDTDFLVIAGRTKVYNGIIYCESGKYSVGELINELRIACEVLDSEELENRIEFI